MELYSRDFWNSRVVSLTGGADLVARSPPQDSHPQIFSEV
jgi:hypothetical protein